MPAVTRSIALLASLIAVSASGHPAAAQVPKPVPGRPYQYWEVLEADGGARKVYFRNDAAVPITITELVIQRCDNTRQRCGTYPANMVVQPGKTVVAFRVEQFDRKLGWSFAYSFHTHMEGQGAMPGGPPPGVVVRPPDGAQPIMVQSVAIDSLVPAVAVITEGASCGKVTVPDLPAGHRALLMVFGPPSQPAARRVLLRLDANGTPYDFVDVRRDPADTTADPRQSQITLDLVRQVAMVRNSGGGQPIAMFRLTGSTLLEARSLDRPGETIARMVRECGGGN